MFTDDELRTLFNPATYAQGRQQSPYMYWLPLIGLHSGMRINEIAQLALADISLQDGIHAFMSPMTAMMMTMSRVGV
jgi:integrase